MSFFDSSNFQLFKGRDNKLRLSLLQNGQTVAINTVTRAVLRFRVGTGDVVLDTDVVGDSITLTDNATVVEVQSDSLSAVPAGVYQTWLTIYDPSAPDGLAWSQPQIELIEFKADEGA